MIEQTTSTFYSDSQWPEEFDFITSHAVCPG